MSSDSGHRGYSSPLRDRRARETRRTILDSALRLVVERGYGATTMRDIAADAGVAVQTIYSSIGTKREIFIAAIDQMEEDAEAEEIIKQYLATDDPLEHLRLRARSSRAIFEAGEDLLKVATQLRATIPELRESFEEGESRHDASVREWMVDRWDDDVFRDDMSREEVADVIATLAGHEVYLRLIHRHKWTRDRYEEWLYQTLVNLVLKKD